MQISQAREYESARPIYAVHRVQDIGCARRKASGWLVCVQMLVALLA